MPQLVLDTKSNDKKEEQQKTKSSSSLVIHCPLDRTLHADSLSSFQNFPTVRSC